ncbi:PTS sugar transporter subunit IIA [Vibrio anguillarum]|uniref:PTS sugar transporter subunit IIA n=1 Tax=Vibrio anguillarum TaxID=55601 RepID=UPI00097E1A6E|nr:PTS sugar transporter subunit IIA [Vibrio anguillarum]MBF4281649.1 phosphocarrier protein HPr [Vibrio anguillarum]MBF4288504.1 phosphocarrier protein HPr [Vibrio anguillarum]MBF4341308.1 phosphocarrier protein HPr [Vibrio anguillarum]MBF4356021.1 phosphocarrier protein HPr [Vibrio anguillarum]MBF4380069.1 phosphocarrier protein HPr [Vibrio anguillarum]
MITTRITFVLKAGGLVSWQLNELKDLNRHFRSVVVLFNITRDNKAMFNHTLQVLSLGSNPGDVCQIAIEGLDAELACMVMTEYLREHTLLISTSHKQNAKAELAFATHSAFQLPFSLQWHYATLGPELSKSEALDTIAKQIMPAHCHDILHALEKREAISPTIIGRGIALPHIIHARVAQPTLAVHWLANPLSWSEKSGDVSLIITLLLPTSAPRTVIKPVTQLTRWLLEEEHRQWLLTAKREETLKAILLHVMAKPCDPIQNE